jgi:hypothetical protein
MSIPKLKVAIEILHSKSGDESMSKKVISCMSLLNRYCLLKREPNSVQTEACIYATTVLVLCPGKLCGDSIQEFLNWSPLGQLCGVSRSLPENSKTLLRAKLHLWKTQSI